MSLDHKSRLPDVENQKTQAAELRHL